MQDILHRQEVEPWEDLSSTFQVMEKISATGLQAVLHVLHDGQDIWKITIHKIRYLELYAKGYPLQVERDSMRTMKPDLLLRVHLCSTLGFFSVALMRSLKSLLRTANLLASWESEVLTSVLEYTYKSTRGFIS